MPYTLYTGERKSGLREEPVEKRSMLLPRVAICHIRYIQFVANVNSVTTVPPRHGLALAFVVVALRRS